MCCWGCSEQGREASGRLADMGYACPRPQFTFASSPLPSLLLTPTLPSYPPPNGLMAMPCLLLPAGRIGPDKSNKGLPPGGEKGGRPEW